MIEKTDLDICDEIAKSIPQIVFYEDFSRMFIRVFKLPIGTTNEESISIGNAFLGDAHGEMRTIVRSRYINYAS